MNVRASNPRVLLAALGHESRFRIALCLLEGERCVGELAAAIGLSQSCTTRHVQALERAGFVKARRDGKRVLVTIEHAAESVAGLVRWLAPGGTIAAAGDRPRDESGPGRAAVAKRRGPKPGAARPGRARAREVRAHSEPGTPHGNAPGAGEEVAHAEAPPSGRNPASPEVPPSRPPRPYDTLEDFLL